MSIEEPSTVDLGFRLACWHPQAPPSDVQVELASSPDDVPSSRHLIIVDGQGVVRIADLRNGEASSRPSRVPLALVVADAFASPSGAQFDAAAWVVSLVQDRFDLPVSALRLVGRWPPGALPRLSNAIRARRGRHPTGEGDTPPIP